MKTSSSKRWLEEHFSDPYVKRAQREGLRARSAYKISEIDQRYHLLHPGMVVVDLGAAPGGWSEYAVTKLKGVGQFFALDLLPIKPIAQVNFLQGDFTDNEVVIQLLQQLHGVKVDLIMSDMAPNLSGIKAVDQARSLNLVESALVFAKQTLKKSGNFIFKAFYGEGFDMLIKQLRQIFTKVETFKPDSSRARSSEIFVLARGFRGTE